MVSKLGGPDIQKESTKWIEKNGTLNVGQTAVTSAGELPCKYLMHVNVPRFRNEYNETSKKQAYLNMEKSVMNILDKANSLGDAETIVIPALSAAPRKAFQSFPRKRCA